MGDPERTEGEVVEVANPVTGSYRKVVVRGVLEAAPVMVGDLSRVGLLTQLFDRRTVLGRAEPRDAADGRPARRAHRSPTTPRSAPAPGSARARSGPAPTSPRWSPPPAPPAAGVRHVRELLASPEELVPTR